MCDIHVMCTVKFGHAFCFENEAELKSPVGAIQAHSGSVTSVKFFENNFCSFTTCVSLVNPLVQTQCFHWCLGLPGSCLSSHAFPFQFVDGNLCEKRVRGTEGVPPNIHGKS